MTAVVLGLGGLVALTVLLGLLNAHEAPERALKALAVAWGAGVLLVCWLAGGNDALVLVLFVLGLIAVALMRIVICRASNVIRHMRYHERDLQDRPRPIDGSAELHEVVDEARAHGFTLVAGGLTEAAAGHGESALLVDGAGRAMEIITGPLGHSVGVVTQTADDRLVYSANQEIDPAQVASTTHISQGLPGAMLGELVAAHLELESRAREDGVAFVAIPADDAVQHSRESDLRMFRDWLRHPWRNSVGSLARGGPRTLLGLRPRPQPGGAAPTSPSPAGG